MKEWFLKVPKICRAYWSGDTLPYMRMLTVKSFLYHNPDWKVILYLPKHPSIIRTWDSRELNYPTQCENCTAELMGLPIDVIELDFADYGFSNRISEVHKSDFIRLFLLANVGGLWTDMDIIYFKPMTELAVNTPHNKDQDTFVCISHYGHSAGFLMSDAGSKYYHFLTKIAQENYRPKEYQGIGATMFNERFPKFVDVNAIFPSVNIDMDAVYAHDAMHIKDIVDGTPARFTPNSIGIHWYAGHPLWGTFMRETNGGKENLSDSIIGNVIKSINY